MPPRGVLTATCLALLAAAASPARAQDVDLAALPDVTSRDFAIDLYSGAALGSGQIVGMGGAALATAEGSAGMLVNPASPASRPATSHDKWDWDWHVDYLNPAIGSDFDNNGVPSMEQGIHCNVLDAADCAYYTLGLVVQRGHWAVGASPSFLQSRAGDLVAQATVVQSSVAYGAYDDQLIIGGGFRVGTFDLLAETDTRRRDDLFSLTGAGLEAGSLWRPTGRNFRVGGSLSLPVSGTNPDVQNCDPLDCNGLILPDRVQVPWRAGAGVAWHRGPTPWNRKVAGDWRDEKSLTLAADLVLVGRVERGYGLEAFAEQKLQKSGRHTVFSVRAGAEYEWKPGRLRVRGGGYWEPARFQDENGDAVPGRVHVTAGFDVRIWSFCFWGDRYRARLSLTADGAQRYGNGGLSIGLWH